MSERDFVKGNILDQIDMLTSRVEELERFALVDIPTDFVMRQGGDIVDWDDVGSTNYSIAREVKRQAGATQWTGSASSGSISITFPEAFTSAPLIFVQVQEIFGSYDTLVTRVRNITTNGFDIYWFSGQTTTQVDLSWLAVGV